MPVPRLDVHPGRPGESPGTPKLHACADAFDAREEHGAVWVKPRDVNPAFPPFDVAGYLPICVLHHTAEAPLELVTDNFCEIEHTPTTHAIFGYDLKRMHEVTVRFEPTDTTVRIINAGPSKRLGPFLRTIVGIRDGFLSTTTGRHTSRRSTRSTTTGGRTPITRNSRRSAGGCTSSSRRLTGSERT